jgi:YD repeat-containing protein
VQGIEIYHYNAKNQLTHIQSGAETLRYFYDKQGKANRKKYIYDTANRQTGIVSVETDGARERCLQSNRYDGEGLRYETEENGKVIRFLFDRGELVYI